MFYKNGILLFSRTAFILLTLSAIGRKIMLRRYKIGIFDRLFGKKSKSSEVKDVSREKEGTRRTSQGKGENIYGKWGS